jgi:hypothetical protein
MTKPHAKDYVAKHLKQVGFLCTQWAYLEWLLEIAIWRFMGLKEAEGRKRTGPMPMGNLARDARALAHRKLTKRAELDALRATASKDQVQALAGVRPATDKRHRRYTVLESATPDAASCPLYLVRERRGGLAEGRTMSASAHVTLVVACKLYRLKSKSKASNRWWPFNRILKSALPSPLTSPETMVLPPLNDSRNSPL